MPEKRYRYVDGINHESFNAPSLRTYYVCKHTPKGVWVKGYPVINGVELDFANGSTRWVHEGARKRFAYPTREEALESYKARKRRQIRIYKGRLEFAKRQLVMAEMICEDEPEETH